MSSAICQILKILRKVISSITTCNQDRYLVPPMNLNAQVLVMCILYLNMVCYLMFNLQSKGIGSRGNRRLK
jgi:hypothetical protein